MGQCIMIYDSVFLDNVAVLGMYKSNGRVSRYMKKKTDKTIRKIYHHGGRYNTIVLQQKYSGVFPQSVNCSSCVFTVYETEKGKL